MEELGQHSSPVASYGHQYLSGALNQYLTQMAIKGYKQISQNIHNFDPLAWGCLMFPTDCTQFHILKKQDMLDHVRSCLYWHSCDIHRCCCIVKNPRHRTAEVPSSTHDHSTRSTSHAKHQLIKHDQSKRLQSFFEKNNRPLPIPATLLPEFSWAVTTAALAGAAFANVKGVWFAGDTDKTKYESNLTA